MTDRFRLRMAPNKLASASKVRHWFNDALLATDGKPSLAACDRLAREFQIIVNRQNNAELERHGPIPRELLNDLSPAEELDKRIGRLRSAAKQLLVATRELEDYSGGYQWTSEDGSIALEEIKHISWRIGGATVAQTSSPVPARGRRRELWHAAAREMAPLISAAMRHAGYGGRLKMTDQEGVTAKVGAAAISWAFGISMQSAGFATAMRMRDRRKCKNGNSFLERYPDVARIKIL